MRLKRNATKISCSLYIISYTKEQYEGYWKYYQKFSWGKRPSGLRSHDLLVVFWKFLEVVLMLLYVGMGKGGYISLGAENARIKYNSLVQSYIYISNNQLALRFHSAKAFTQFLSGLLYLCRIKNTSALCNPISNESSVFKGFYRVVEFIMLYKGRIVTINFNSWRIRPYYITNYMAAAKLSDSLKSPII